MCTKKAGVETIFTPKLLSNFTNNHILPSNFANFFIVIWKATSHDVWSDMTNTLTQEIISLSHLLLQLNWLTSPFLWCDTVQPWIRFWKRWSAPPILWLSNGLLWKKWWRLQKRKWPRSSARPCTISPPALFSWARMLFRDRLAFKCKKRMHVTIAMSLHASSARNTCLVSCSRAMAL